MDSLFIDSYVQAFNTIQQLSKSLENWPATQPGSEKSPPKAKGLKAMFKGVQKGKNATNSTAKETGSEGQNLDVLQTASANAASALAAAVEGLVPRANQNPPGKAPFEEQMPFSMAKEGSRLIVSSRSSAFLASRLRYYERTIHVKVLWGFLAVPLTGLSTPQQHNYIVPCRKS